jgi:hypothetical protein
LDALVAKRGAFSRIALASDFIFSPITGAASMRRAIGLAGYDGQNKEQIKISFKALLLRFSKKIEQCRAAMK